MGLVQRIVFACPAFCFVVASVSLLGVTGCSGSNGPQEAAPPVTHSRGPTTAESAGTSAKNPVARDEQSVRLGRGLYAKHCQSCHGPGGRGDGPAVGRLNVEVTDLTHPDVQSESDGELFTVITRGSKPMPAYRKLLGEEQRWHVVNYLRAAFGPPGGST